MKRKAKRVPVSVRNARRYRSPGRSADAARKAARDALSPVWLPLPAVVWKPAEHAVFMSAGSNPYDMPSFSFGGWHA